MVSTTTPLTRNTLVIAPQLQDRMVGGLRYVSSLWWTTLAFTHTCQSCHGFPKENNVTRRQACEGPQPRKKTDD